MTVNRCGKFSVTVRKGVRGKPKKGKQAKRRQQRMKRACFEDGPRFSGAKHTETGWADGVFLLHAGRKDFFDTLTPACVSTQAGALFSAEVIFPSRRIFYCGQLLFLP